MLQLELTSQCRIIVPSSLFQGEAAERIALLLCEYGDKFQKEFDNDQNLQKLMTEGTSDTDTGEPSTSSVLAHVRIVVERIFGINSNGESNYTI